ncbi:hypothetical protein [Embleya scabrispora]|uniref:hypothetical protein n=1 Tax=Embleya scabrispora TaxID=159449 RepID=UPI000378310B|nr:hypothetical protein [Embleya scabrispora]
MSGRGRAGSPARGVEPQAGVTCRRRRRVLGWAAALTATIAVVGVSVAFLGPSSASGRATPASGGGPASRAEAVNSAAVVATVDEVPLTAGELRRAAMRLRAEVVAEFPITGARAQYWRTPIAGRTPHEVLTERALRAAAQDSVLRRWAQQAGVLADPTEAGFRARFEAENARRAAARASRRPVPGVPSYDEDGFARNEAAELARALRESPSDRVDLSESRLRDRYAELAGAAGPSAEVPSFEQARDRIRLDLLSAAFDGELSRRVATARTIALPAADAVIGGAE